MTRGEIVVWSVVAAVLAGVLGFAAARRTPPTDAGADARTDAEVAGVSPQSTSGLLPAAGAEIGDHAAVERSGRAMNTSELRGRFVVADFIFTNCAGPCPLMTQKMAQLQGALGKATDVRLVSFTVDPARDTPEVLSDYAAKYGADPKHWLFLRTEPEDLRDVAYDRLRMVKDRSDLFIHSPKFALLDRSGKLRGLYTPIDDEDWLTKLTADLALLRKEPKPEPK